MAARKYPAALYALAHALRAQGRSCGEIARALGVPRPTAKFLSTYEPKTGALGFDASLVTGVADALSRADAEGRKAAAAALRDAADQIEGPSLASKLKEMLEAHGQSTLFLPGHDDAVVGLTEDSARPGVMHVVYNTARILRTLQVRDGMTLDEAREFFDFNLARTHSVLGEPIFLQC